MNTKTTINLMETDRLLCDTCYQDLLHENIGDYDPNTWLHAVIPWHLDAVCSCCEASHPDKRSTVALTQAAWDCGDVPVCVLSSQSTSMGH